MFSKLSPLAETGIPTLSCANAAGRLLHSDSRQIKQGDIFVACPGEYADGRSYIPAAVANGAAFVFGTTTADSRGIPNGKSPIKASKI
ncbi:UDP-N-acetylmuramoylalanyl-D-glutamate--2, 6-diaminopimelate ligase [Neisseria gonorrhoeae]|uniref:UDP-N-acetylmuramoylalanyl-D-glutamate--2, 6-diaminopimelate ligase n=1 Tax=Neisseria gonorrhoeae TaxID=485 RepID=A0A378VTE7_NEIGO|nr:UDP-N-acetylmuramoylalanyl-D-glutamate--2, 6-diaminopimelate ligase [Neisseria gonorrhoeae]